MLNTIDLTGGTLGIGLVETIRQGDTFAKVGWRTQITSGIVTNPNFEFLGLTNQVRTNALGGRGDSGGVVFTTPSVGSIWGGNTAGIVTGGDGDMSHTMAFSRATNIRNNFGVNRH